MKSGLGYTVDRDRTGTEVVEREVQEDDDLKLTELERMKGHTPLRSVLDVDM